jgi:hypothetical protein
MRSIKPVRAIIRAALAGTLVLVAPALAGCSSGSADYTLTNMPANLAVNPFLWQATMDTLNFLPVAQADPAAGRIRTGWRASGSNVPGEEARVDVLIVGRTLRSDAIAVDVYRRIGGGPERIDAKASVDVHTAIVTRARQLMNSAENY